MTQLLMHRVTACDFLDMDEITFDAYIAPLVTALQFEDQMYYLTEDIECALYSLVEASGEPEVKLHLVD